MKLGIVLIISAVGLMLLTGCVGQKEILAATATETKEAGEIPRPTVTTAARPTRTATSTAAISPPTITATPTASKTSTPTTVPTPIVQPIIRETPGDIYETVLSIPAGDGKIIRYVKQCCSATNGPNAIAVLPDGSFMITENVNYRMLHYDQNGKLLNIIELKDLGVSYARDLRYYEDKLYLWDFGYKDSRVLEMSLDGTVIDSHEFPNSFIVDGDMKLEGGMTGIAIDCEGNIILEAVGKYLLHLADVQVQADFEEVTNGYFCNGKLYQNLTEGVFRTPKLTDGEVIYETKLTDGLGGLNFLNVFQDGSFYVKRSDVFRGPGFDITIHYVGPDGIVKGVARVPMSERYYPVIRYAAINSEGEVFVLLPRAESMDIIRLNFYEELEPLIPGAVIPNLSISTNDP